MATTTNFEMASDAANEVTNGIITPSAADKVLITTELLEAILLSLDFPTLLLSQAINSTINATIINSPKIQEKFFFKPPNNPQNPIIIYTPPEQHSALWWPIRTPEGHIFSITQYSREPSVEFHFRGRAPDPQTPPTGSWRGIHVQTRPGVRQFGLSDGMGHLERYVEPSTKVRTLGGVLDALLGPEARIDAASPD